MNKEFKRGFKSAFSLTSNDRARERIPILSTEDRMRQNWENVGSDIKKSMDKADIELGYTKETV
jgi:hypothetical protein